MKIKNFKLVLILLLASFFRLYGVNWDQGHHLHPDERFLTMVETAIKIPATIGDYLNPQVSTMNPYNNNYSFFVYGTFPLNLVKVVGEWTKQNAYDTIHLLGRQFSALFDIGVVLLVFFIGRKLWSERAGLWSAFLYSVMVLPIQLSHFFAVDTFLNFFIVLSFYFLVRLLTSHSHFPTHISHPTSQFLTTGALGASFGFALACKISAIYFVPIIGLGFLYMFKKSIISKQKLLFVVCCLLFVVTTLLAFRFNQPQAFSSGDLLNWQPNSKFIANLKELKSWGKMDSWYPPDVYWISRQAFWFAPGNLVFWGLGLPLSLVVASSIAYHLLSLKDWLKKKEYGSKRFPLLLILVWVVGFFLYQNLQFAKNMRYFFFIYPFLSILAGSFIEKLLAKHAGKSAPTIVVCIVTTMLFWPVCFMAIYSHPITRVEASEWIYNNIPQGSTIACEHWDDCLPVGIDRTKYSQLYQYTEGLPLYDAETPEKWQKVNSILTRSDYIVLSSNRLYGSIPRFPKRYPESTKYYDDLLNNRLDFVKVAEFTSRPCFPPIGKPLVCFNDDWAEETFTVYDHPKVMIFKSKGAGE